MGISDKPGAQGRHPPGTPGRIRTSDQELRRLLLCPLSYGGPSPPRCGTRPSGLLRGAGEGNRTLTASLEGWSSTIELHPPDRPILTRTGDRGTVALISRVSRHTYPRRPHRRHHSGPSIHHRRGRPRSGRERPSDAIIPVQRPYLRLRSAPTSLAHEKPGASGYRAERRPARRRTAGRAGRI